MYAEVVEQTFVCRMLLEHGASVDETDIDRDDEHGNHEHCPTPVATSALYARENVLRALLEVAPESSGAAVPVTGWTPLMLAASSGNKASDEDEGNKHLRTRTCLAMGNSYVWHGSP